MIKAATTQFQHKPGDKQYNLERIESFCKEGAEEGVQLIAFPEMCISGYWHVRNLSAKQVGELAESVPDGPSCVRLKELSARYNLIIGAGLIEVGEDGAFYNTYAVCMPDGRIEKHRKLHCFISEHMASGDSFTVFDTPLGVRIGVLICYDNNIVENARMMGLKGVDVLMAPHQTGGTNSRSPFGMKRIDIALWDQRHTHPEQIEAEFNGPKGRGWLMRWLPSRAHDNGMFILFSNGVGIDDDEVRTGNAMIIDCYGRIINETSKAADALVVGELDLDLLPLSTGRRWMRARRTDLYGDLTAKKGTEVGAREARFSTAPTE